MKNYFSNKEEGKLSKVSRVELKSLKNSEMLSKVVERYQINTVVESKENKYVDRDAFEELCQKVSKYLIMTSEVINSSEVAEQLSKKLKKYSEQISILMNELDSNSLSDLKATKNLQQL